MSRDLPSRAQRLSEQAPRAPGHRRRHLVGLMAAVRVQRAAACVIPALCFAAVVLVMAAISIAVGRCQGHWSPAGSGPLRAVEDARWAGDYRASDAVAVLPLDERSTLVATAGSGVQHLRADGGPHGLWETLDAEHTAGVLVDPHLTAAHDAGPRLYFVGSGGSLVSSSRDLDDWRLHLGSRGFAREVDLAKALTALAVDSSEGFFVVGTKQNGAALYDVHTRQWVTLSPSEAPPLPAVTEIVIHDRSVWVGTARGLRVYTWSRIDGGIQVRRDTDADLPPWYARDPVHALRLVGTGGGAWIDCVIGEGAHLTRPAWGGAWIEIVGEGVHEYKKLSGPAVASTLIDFDGEVILGLPGFGVARYLPDKRSLIPWTEAGATPPASGWPEIVPGPQFGSKHDDVWLIAHPSRNTAGQLYRWLDSTWGSVIRDVSALTFASGVPIAKLASGSLAVVELDGRAAEHSLFLPMPEATAPLGSADVSSTSLVVAQGRRLLRYTASARGWKTLFSTDADIEQVRIGRAGIGMVEKDGQAAESAGSGVVQVLGPSSLPLHAGDVQSAAVFGRKLWFLRSGGTYAYTPHPATISSEQAGLRRGFEPRTLRATGSTLYAIGAIGRNPRKLAIRYRNDTSTSWTVVDGITDDSDEDGPGDSWDDSTALVTREALVVLRTNRSLLVRSDRGWAAELLQSQAPARWKQLEAAPLGWLFGLTTDGRALSYAAGTANWAPIGHDPWGPGGSRGNDWKLIVTSDGGRDRLFLGGRIGIAGFTIRADAVDADTKPILTDREVIAFDVADGNLWALTRPSNSSLAIQVLPLKGGSWRSMWMTSFQNAPNAGDWRGGIWAGFVGRELWWVTSRGELFRYDLDERSWGRHSLPSRSFDRLRTPDDKELWWIDHGRLMAWSPAMTGSFQLDRISFNVDKLRALVASLVWFRDLGLRVARVVPTVQWLVTDLALQLITASLRRAIAVRAPFDRSFEGSVIDYAVEPDRLLVSTWEGVFTFKRHGFELEPERFEPDLGRRDWPLASPCGVTDPSSQWRIACTGSGLAVERREETDSWREVRIAGEGFEHDRLIDLFVSGDRILATTPTGVVAFHGGAGGFTYDHFDPHDRRGAGVLRKLEGHVFRFEGGGIVTVHDATAATHWRAVSSWPRDDRRYGLRWSHDATGDALDPSDFDASRGKFRQDIVERLVKDVNGVPWIETAAGWRDVQLGPLRPVLGQVTAQVPAPDRRPILADVNPRWQVRVEPSDRADKVLFTFRPTGRTYDDPFGDRGRLPDDHARSVAAGDDHVWFATDAGLRTGMSEDIELAGRRVLDVRTSDGSLYARTDGGDFQRSGTAWIAAPSIDHLFPAVRELRVAMGPGLEIKAREERVKNRFQTVLNDFDRSDRRFVQDRIGDIAGTDAGLWALSPAGAQHLVLQNGEIANQRAVLPGTVFTVLRSDKQRRACAIDSSGAGWILSARPREVPAANRTNPCELLGGSLSELVSWKRELSAIGDVWTLETRIGPLSFIDGKLSTDVVLDLVSATQPAWEITAAGAVLRDMPGFEKRRLVAPRRPGTRLALDGSRLVSRDLDGTFAYDAGAGTWVSTPTTALDSPRMRFDGTTWQFETIGALHPALASMNDHPEELALNRQGQFSFDHATAIAGRTGEVWILTEGGVAVHAPTDHRPLRAAATRWVPPSCRPQLRGDDAGRMWLSCPAGLFVSDGDAFRPATGLERDLWSSRPALHWSGRVGGATIVASVDPHALAGAGEIQLSSDEGGAMSMRAPSGVVALAGAGTLLWVLTPRQLYAVDLTRIHGGNTTADR